MSILEIIHMARIPKLGYCPNLLTKLGIPKFQISRMGHPLPNTEIQPFWTFLMASLIYPSNYKLPLNTFFRMPSSVQEDLQSFHLQRMACYIMHYNQIIRSYCIFFWKGFDSAWHIVRYIQGGLINKTAYSSLYYQS